MFRLVLHWFFAAALLFSSVACADPITLKLSLFTSDRSSIYRLLIRPFVEAVNNDGKGLVQIKVYFSGTLGKSPAQLPKFVADDTADLAVIVPGYSPEQFPDTAVIELPSLFRNAEIASRIYTRLLNAGVLEGYDRYLAIGGFVTAGESIHSRKPTASLADLKGQRIRTNNDIEAETLQKFGAIPIRLSINNTLNAIGQGKIDGATVPPAMLFEFGIGRVTNRHYMLRLGGAPTALVMNRKKFESLPAEAQAIIRKYSGEQWALRSASGFDALNREILKKLEADLRRKVTFPSPADLAVSQRVFDQVIEHWANLMPHNRRLLTRVRTEIAKLHSNN